MKYIYAAFQRIEDVSATNSCTASTYDKRPAKPGEYLLAGIKMTSKDTGFFDKVVTINLAKKKKGYVR